MKKLTKTLALLLAIASLLSGCGGAKEPVQTEPTEPAPVEVATQEELLAAQDEGTKAVLTADIQLTQGVYVRNPELDGGGHTITGMPHVKEDASTENALLLGGGIVKDLTVTGSYRCLGDSTEYPTVRDVLLRNVTAEASVVAMHFGRGAKNKALFAENCTFRGWVLINSIKDIKFTSCTFSHTAEGKNGYFRAFQDVILTDCRFESFVDENGQVAKYNISFHSNTSGVTIYLQDCYVDDTLITQENVQSLLNINSDYNKVVVANSVD